MSEEKEKSLLPAPVEEFSIGAFNVKNFEEIKKELGLALKKYETVEVTDEFYAEAKVTRAELNKVATALDNRRKELEKRYMEPFNVGKAQIADLVNMVKQVSGKIDTGIKLIEEKKRQEKEEDIKTLFNEIDNPHKVELKSIWTESWLNAGTSMKKIKTDIETFLEKVDDEVKTITDTVYADEPKRANEAKKFYLENGYDLKAALAKEKELYDYTHRPAPAHVEAPTAPAPAQEETPVGPGPVEEAPKTESICFRVYGTRDELLALGNYIKEHNLRFETLGR